MGRLTLPLRVASVIGVKLEHPAISRTLAIVRLPLHGC